VSALTLQVRRVGDVQVPLPKYQTEGSAGMDLCAALEAPVVIAPGDRAFIPTGIAIALPPEHEGQVRARSGLALRHGIGIVNAPGTVDEDYRGELGVVLVNHGKEPFRVEPLARIAQLVVARVARVDVVAVDALDETGRGARGYGSTGV
jgi:dUTP pyrophosphatase